MRSIPTKTRLNDALQEVSNGYTVFADRLRFLAKVAITLRVMGLSVNCQMDRSGDKLKHSTRSVYHYSTVAGDPQSSSESEAAWS